MTSPHLDPNAVNHLDDFELDNTFDNLDSAQSHATAQNLAFEKLDNLANSTSETDPFIDFSFDDLLADDGLSHPSPSQSQLSSQTQVQTQTPASTHSAPSTVSSDLSMSGTNDLIHDEWFDLLNNPLPTPSDTVPTIDSHSLDFEITPTSSTSVDPMFVATPQNAASSMTDSVMNTANVVTDSVPANDNTHNRDTSIPTATAAAAGVGAGLVGTAIHTNLSDANDTDNIPNANATLTKKSFGLNLGKKNRTTQAPATPKEKVQRKAFFAKKQTPILPPTGGMPPAHTTAPKKNNILPLLLLGGLLALGIGYWLMQQSTSEPTSAPVAKKTTPSPAASTTPAVATATASATAPAITNSVSAPASTITNNNVSTTTATSSTNGTPSLSNPAIIKPEDITAPALPTDNATAKEEIDRLGQQSKQLEAQEKMMEEQLNMMNELSSKKEERIAILEKQIAQIEAQKSQAAK